MFTNKKGLEDVFQNVKHIDVLNYAETKSFAILNLNFCVNMNTLYPVMLFKLRLYKFTFEEK